MLLIFIIIYMIFFTMLILTTYLEKYKKYYTLAKIFNSLGFIIVASYGGLVVGNKIDFYYMLPALIFCFLGDVFLGINSQFDKKIFFVAGLFSFTIAHILYMIDFSRFAPMALYDLMLPILSIFITYMLIKLENMDVQKELRIFILMYSFFVTLLLTKGMDVLIICGINIKSVLIFIGALMFFISDFIILFLYFYKKKHHIVGTINLLLYYWGMFILALSNWYNISL